MMLSCVHAICKEAPSIPGAIYALLSKLITPLAMCKLAVRALLAHADALMTIGASNSVQQKQEEMQNADIEGHTSAPARHSGP